MFYIKKLALAGTIIYVGILSTNLAHAQAAPNSWNQAIAKFKNEQSALTRSVESELIQQQRFVEAAVEVFIQRAQQVKQIVSTQTDIFPPKQAQDLLKQIDNNLVALQSYQKAIVKTENITQLRDLVGQITAHRATTGNEIRRSVLTFYVKYFQNTIQKKVAARYQAIQEYIYGLRMAGKDTTNIEKTFAPAAGLINKITSTMAQLLVDLENNDDQYVSLDDIELALQSTQKNISAMYDIFRKITFQENTLFDVNKEEQGIQGMFPDTNL